MQEYGCEPETGLDERSFFAMVVPCAIFLVFGFRELGGHFGGSDCSPWVSGWGPALRERQEFQEATSMLKTTVDSGLGFRV